MFFKRALHLGRSPQRDVDAEIRFHLESRIDDLVRGGLSPDDARRQAGEEFGDLAWVRNDLVRSTRRRAARRSRLDALRDVGADVRYTVRSVARSPGFALIVASTLGLGIGGAAATYGVADRILLRGPQHVVAPAALRRVYAHVQSKSSGEFTTSSLGYAAYTAMRDHARSTAQAAAYSANDGRVGRGVDAMPAMVGTATADFFPLLGVRPERGRFFTKSEDAPPNGMRVVVLDHGYWMRQMGGSNSAIGRTITINDQPFTIIGVAPRGFTGAELRHVDLWIPVSAGQHPRADWPTTWSAQWLNVIVRLKPGLSTKQVNDDVTAAFRATYSGDDREWRAADITARGIALTGAGRERLEAPIARWLAGVAVLLVLIAAANVANLLIVRAMRRRHEIAVRLALGIGRIRLARLLMLESVAYAMLGAAVGVACAFGGGTLMRRVFPPSIAWTTPIVNMQVVVLSVALALLIAGVVVLAPIAQVLATDLAGVLRDGTGNSLHGSRLRRTLLAMQIGFSVILLVAAGLFVRSLSNVEHLDLGVEPDRVLIASVGWPRPGNPSPEQAAAAKQRHANSWRELRERVARLPGVDHAALAIGSPFGNGFGVDVRVPGRDTLPSAPGGGPFVNAVDADYFSTAGTKLVRGRTFRPNEGAHSERVAIVNQTMTSLVWPNDDPLGKCIIVDDAPCATVVGIAHDARRFGIDEPPSMQYYIPFGQESGFGGTVLLVRPHSAPSDFVQTLRRAVIAAEPDANVVTVASMQDRVDSQIRPWRLGATMFELFGGFALLVAAVGLYGAIAYNVAQRTREFGIRIAVGSDAGGLMRRVVYEGVRVASVGLVLGTAAALLAGSRLAPLLFRVSPHDPAVFIAVAAMLLCCAVLACAVPAWRAARTDPVVALRS